MAGMLNLSHRVCESTCYVNGLEDILEWKSRKNWMTASSIFEMSGKIIEDLCRVASIRGRKQVSDLLSKVADIEEKAYKIL